MSGRRTRVCILGGGPAGVGAAWKLAREGKARVTLLEAGERFGGHAASFEHGEHRLDLGSHRLHPACAPEILADVRALLGEELLDRPRHGRIRLLGRWIRFPLRPVDLALHLPKRFAAGSLVDAATRRVRRRRDGDETFASVLEAGLGRTICRHFYFPYARKIWGVEPEELSPEQARRRVSAASFAKLLRKVAGRVPGLAAPGAGRFFYPRGGYGRISEAYAAAAGDAGADLRAGWTVTAVERVRAGATFAVRARGPEGAEREVEADHVWSTLPLPALARLVLPAAPPDVLAAAEGLEFRGLVLCYLELATGRFSEYDAHYFPGPNVALTRLSEPKNYADRIEPRGRTVLCAEVPCDVGDATWRLSEQELAERLASDLARAGLPLPSAPVSVLVRRLPRAYPIYRLGHERPLAVLDRWAESIPGLLTYGRQGLFAHDNTHHALAMAYAACGCLEDGAFDRRRWLGQRREFEQHVVED